jgi:hypothetical protein
MVVCACTAALRLSAKTIEIKILGLLHILFLLKNKVLKTFFGYKPKLTSPSTVANLRATSTNTLAFFHYNNSQLLQTTSNKTGDKGLHQNETLHLPKTIFSRADYLLFLGRV